MEDGYCLQLSHLLSCFRYTGFYFLYYTFRRIIQNTDWLSAGSSDTESYKFLIENVGLFIKSGKYSIDRRSYTGYQYCTLCNGCTDSRFTAKGINIALHLLLQLYNSWSCYSKTIIWVHAESKNYMIHIPDWFCFISVLLSHLRFWFWETLWGNPISLEGSDWRCNFHRDFLQSYCLLWNLQSQLYVLSTLLPAWITSSHRCFIQMVFRFFPFHCTASTAWQHVWVPWDLVSAMGWIILLPIIFVAVFENQIMDGIMAGGVKPDYLNAKNIGGKHYVSVI